MRLAVFTDVLLDVPGGIPSSIMAQKRSLEELGHEIVVFAPGFAASLKNMPAKERKNIITVPTHHVFRPNGAPLSKRPGKVERFVLSRFPEFDFDIVHVHYEASCSIAGMKLARRFNKPLVQTMHGREDMAVQINIPKGLKTFVATVLCFLHSRYIPHFKQATADASLAPTLARRKMWNIMVNHANYADKVITPSEHFKTKIVEMGVEKPVFVVSNGVDDDMVAELDARVKRMDGSLIRKVEEGDRLRIFWNSRLSREKRIMPFMEALSLMREPFCCTFVGDGNGLKSARCFAEKHNLMHGKNQQVVFCGRVPHEEVLDKMIKQHLSVTVSYGFDTQGLTLLEAEATGLPVFFCDPDMKENVPKGGFVMADGCSPAQMAHALDMVARNPKEIEKMSEVMLSHRKDVLQSTQIKKLLDVYKIATS